MPEGFGFFVFVFYKLRGLALSPAISSEDIYSTAVSTHGHTHNTLTHSPLAGTNREWSWFVKYRVQRWDWCRIEGMWRMGRSSKKKKK